MHTRGDASSLGAGPTGERENERHRQLTSRIARVDERLQQWDVRDALEGARRRAGSDARTGQRASGANYVRAQGPAPALPPLTRQALTELRALLLEELQGLKQKP